MVPSAGAFPVSVLPIHRSAMPVLALLHRCQWSISRRKPLSGRICDPCRSPASGGNV